MRITIKIILLIFLLYHINLGFTQNISFNGNIDYSQDKSKNLQTNNDLTYKLLLYKTFNYDISISSTLNVDLDCFNNEIRETNVFTTLRIDF
jgi:hypothetical protein